MADIALPGLKGTNPLGYFAALGVLRTLARTNGQARLRWEQTPRPTPVVTGAASLAQIVELIVEDLGAWQDAPALQFEDIDDVKLTDQTLLRRYLLACSGDRTHSGELSAALVAEGVVDGKGSAKPTDFHFTAGQQKFLAMVRDIRSAVTEEDLEAALSRTWVYDSKLPSLMWDVTDDRVYALSAFNPSKEKKLSQPGAEWLALLGLSAFPVIAGKERTLTPGCAGKWKSGSFTSPLWAVPLGFDAARSLIGLAAQADPKKSLESLGCFALLESGIRRSDQGGYGTFAPPVVVWQQTNSPAPIPDPFSN